jgi:L-ascorbate metabolism protein UlaG (beta-lactamase superfamily)
MRVTKFGHSCLLVEEGAVRLLLDPGGLSKGFEQLDGLSAILFTHQHADHLSLDHARQLLARNPAAVVVADEGSAPQLAAAGIQARTVHHGDQLDLGVPLEVLGSTHGIIHPELPPVPNVGYLVAGRLFHPGDSFTQPDRPVEVLAVPATAPWLKVEEAVEYMRAVRPEVVVPIHEALTTMPQLYYGVLGTFAGKQDAEWRNLDDGQPFDFG